MTTELHVREFAWRDVERIFQIATGAFQQDFEILGSEKETFKRGLAPYRIGKWIQKITRNEYFKFYVGEINGKVVAVILVIKGAHYWYITTLMVDEKYRRRGYGREILTFACTTMCSGGCERLILHVPEDNTAARTLYQSLGFQFFEKLINYWRTSEQVNVDLPKGYCLTLIDVHDPRALEITDKCRSPHSFTIFGKTELPPWHRRMLERIFQTGIAEKYALTTGGNWVGICTFKAPLEKKGAAMIYLHMLPEHRGKGLEEALLSWGLTRACNLGLPRVAVQAKQEHTQLTRACEAFNFIQIEVLEGMFKNCTNKDRK